MKFKIGDKIYDDETIPVMVILTDQDKINIKNMLDECTKYAVFPESFGTQEEMHEWMDV